MTTATERTLVRYTATDGIAVIELTNPPANTYSYDMMRQLDDAILQARFDDNVHVSSFAARAKSSSVRAQRSACSMP